MMLALVIGASAAPSPKMRFKRDGSNEHSFSVDPPTSTSTSTSESSTPTVPPASEDPNPVLFNTTSAQRGPLGASVLGPNNIELDLQNPDLLAPPTTDQGSV